ncbi:MAG: acetyltransferase [Elusimicrobia bacterium]|nr:acetyltransferase [Elusimicrobiota bacterium]
MEKIILLGGGGHCKSVIDAVGNSFEIAGILDGKKTKGEKVLGIAVLGGDEMMAECFSGGIKLCFISVGSVGDTKIREALAQMAVKAGFKFPDIVHPSAVVSKYATLGDGNFISAGAIINAGATVGNHCIINTGASIDHDCEIGDFVHIAPGVSLSGGVKIGARAHLGTGASVIQNIKIGAGAIVGAGSLVTKDVPEKAVVFGVPAKAVNKNAK